VRNQAQVRGEGSQPASSPQTKTNVSLERLAEAVDSANMLIKLMARVIAEDHFQISSVKQSSLETLCLQGVNEKCHAVATELNESFDCVTNAWMELENRFIAERAKAERRAERSAAK
jgi:hypothetical protein